MKRVAVVAIIFLVAGVAAAQIPTSGNVYFGYSNFRTQLPLVHANLNGWEGSVEGKIFPFVGMVADFSGHYGTQNFVNPGATCVPGAVCPTSSNTHEENFLFGPRISASVGSWRPFAEALFGAGHINSTAFGSDTSFAYAIGGGLDYRIIRPIAWRFQGDYVRTSFYGNSQNDVRITTGLVVRF